MIEIAALILLWQAMGRRIRSKGRSPIPWQIAAVIIWFSTMLVTYISYCVYLAITVGEEAAQSPGPPGYIYALVAAAIVETLLFQVARVIPARRQVDENSPS